MTDVSALELLRIGTWACFHRGKVALLPLCSLLLVPHCTVVYSSCRCLNKSLMHGRDVPHKCWWRQGQAFGNEMTALGGEGDSPPVVYQQKKPFAALAVCQAFRTRDFSPRSCAPLSVCPPHRGSRNGGRRRSPNAACRGWWQELLVPGQTALLVTACTAGQGPGLWQALPNAHIKTGGN